MHSRARQRLHWGQPSQARGLKWRPHAHPAAQPVWDSCTTRRRAPGGGSASAAAGAARRLQEAYGALRAAAGEDAARDLMGRALLQAGKAAAVPRVQ